MNLFFPEIDKKQTIKNVDLLLSAYHGLKRVAGQSYKSKITTTYSLELKTFSNARSEALENHVARKDLAREKLESIRDGFNALNPEDRKRLHDKYLDWQRPTDINIYLNYGESESTYYRKLAKAQLHFAECFDDGGLLAEAS